VVRLEGGGELVVPDAVDGRVLVALRPSALTVHTSEPHEVSARNVWPGRVESFAPLADRIRLTVSGQQSMFVDVTASAVAELTLAPGRPVWLTAKATDVRAYPAPPATPAAGEPASVAG
jgi:molybdate transport system ATP-binding protein